MSVRAIELRCVCVLLIALCSVAAVRPRPKVQKPSPASQMDYGPFLSYSILSPERGHHQVLAARGITIRLGNAAVCFDTDTMRMAAGWTGGFLDLSRTNLASLKGTSAATPGGELFFTCADGPGWSAGGGLDDPRPMKLGPLPPNLAHYKGLYRHGRQVVLWYSVGDADVLELPGSVGRDRIEAITRTIRVGPSNKPLTLLICDGDSNSASVADLKTMSARTITGPAQSSVAMATSAGKPLAAAVLAAPVDARLVARNANRVELELPAIQNATTFKVILAPAGAGLSTRLARLREIAGSMDDLPALCHGGPPLWNQPIVTHGQRATDKQAYVVDTIALPDDNPWHSWMRPGALDFFSDGRCALCTMNGDVWIASNIDASLQKVTWKRFATGLFEPLGLKIVNDQIYVLGRDQITRLHDLGGSGEANLYENFNNGGVTSPIYHAFQFDLQTDSAGNFFYVVDGNAVPLNVPMHGCVLKVSKDGHHTEVFATGLRAANGDAIGPDDQFVCADNQGHWTPVCRINLVKRDGFYGFNGDPRVTTKADVARQRKTYDPPICWIPYELDNSTGGQVFATGGKWGPLHDRMLSTSYGKCKLFEVMSETVDGMPQGATVRLPLDFASGIMRGRMNPIDGQLYVCGLKGWQTSAIRDGCLQRVRYTGKPFYLPQSVHVRKDGIEIGFTCPLDAHSAEDPQNYSVQQWNYKWSSRYGSDKYKVSQPGVVGTDDVDVQSAHLFPDHRTVFLKIDHLWPVMQMDIQVQLTAADGNSLDCQIDATINRVPGLNAAPVLSAEDRQR